LWLLPNVWFPCSQVDTTGGSSAQEGKASAIIAGWAQHALRVDDALGWPVDRS